MTPNLSERALARTTYLCDAKAPLHPFHEVDNSPTMLTIALFIVTLGLVILCTSPRANEVARNGCTGMYKRLNSHMEKMREKTKTPSDTEREN